MSSEGMTARLVELVTELFCRPGSPYHEDGPGLHRPRIACEWDTGQWVMLTAKEGPLWGWMSWYRVSDAALALLRAGEEDRIVRERIMLDVLHGPHCYISTAVVAPWAPEGTYRRLYELVCEANRDAQSICWRLVDRHGRSQWCRRVNDGTADWQRHRRLEDDHGQEEKRVEADADVAASEPH